MSGWVRYHLGGCPVEGDQTVAVRLAGDPTHSVEVGKASEFFWGAGDGRIAEYRVIDTSGGAGDVASTEPGSAARYLAGKPPLELIPLGLIAEVLWHERGVPAPVDSLDTHEALKSLGMFQMRQQGRPALTRIARVLDADRQAWQDCAAVFDYGRRKYAEWNWAKGMAWSIPIGCAARHLLAMARGEENDPESGLPHRGHVMCNIVMLLWFMSEYVEGDDRYTPPLPHGRVASLERSEL